MEVIYIGAIVWFGFYVWSIGSDLDKLKKTNEATLAELKKLNEKK